MAELQQYDLRIDGPLLRSQRELLYKLLDVAHRGVPYVLRSPTERELLEGIVEMLDAIADQAHDRHGIDCLIADQGRRAGHDRP